MSTIGISYPASPDYTALELKQCENCPRMFVRRLGAALKFCGHCIADHLAHPIPWCRGSLGSWVRGGKDTDEKREAKHPASRKHSVLASPDCRIGQHSLCSKMTCPCSCHPQNAQ